MEAENKTNDLLNAVAHLFMKLGIKSLTMDDIARHLGISKKTLYQYVTDKKDLVQQCLNLAISEEQCVLTDIVSDDENAIDISLKINIKISEKLQTIQPAVMYDLQKYYPEAWAIMENHKKCFIYDMVVKNINVGIKQGLYRNNVNPEIIARIYVTMIDKIFDVDLFPTHKYNFETIHKEMARYHIRGIASKKGIKYLTEKLNNDAHQF